MHDYVYPSIFFSYSLFLLFVIGAAFFLVRSMKHGYWGKDSEEAKYRMLEDDDGDIKHS
jgi:hypothetical protein